MTKNDPTLEERIQQLERDVAWFESDDFVLDEAIERYQQIAKEGEALEKELQALENTIDDMVKE